MALASRDGIYAALFARLQGAVPACVTFTRAFRDPDQFAPEQHPVLILAGEKQTAATRRGLPTIWHLGAQVIIYVRTSETDVSPETQINAVIDQIVAALERLPTEPIQDMTEPRHTTLGGLVSRCYIEGSIEVIQAPVGGAGAAIVPIEMIVSA